MHLSVETEKRPNSGIEVASSSIAPSVLDMESGVFFALIAGLAWVPFWLGSNRLFPWGVNAIYFSSLTLAYELSLIVRSRPHPVGLHRIWVPAILFTVVVVWSLVQASTLVPTSLAHPIYAMAADALQTDVAGSISVNRASTMIALIRLITDACVLWLSLQLCRDPSRALSLLKSVGVIAAVYAAYGLITYAVFAGGIPFFEVVNAEGFVRSTFVNRNSFATFAGLGLIAQLAVLLRMYRHEIEGQQGLRSYRFSQFIEATGRRGWWNLGLAFVTVVALLATGSRGGILATGLGLFALLVLSFSRQRRRRTERIEAILFVTGLLLACFLLFGDIFVGRIAASGFADVSRWSVDLITVRSILDSPFLGFGYGTFADIFPLYRDQSISPVGIWDKAHNTYLEVWQGLGFIIGSALIGALGCLGYQSFVGAFRRKQNASASIVAAGTTLLVGVHALVDFSLQIEAVAVTYMALLGAGVAQSESSRYATAD